MLIFYIFIFLLGLAVGSFVNVLLFRLPAGEELSGRSRCPYCGMPLKWYELIPILSFLFLKGRCRSCKVGISFRYPLVELFYGVGFLGVSFLNFKGVFLGWFLVLLSTFLFLALYDIKHLILPDEFLVFLLLWVLAGTLFYWRDTIKTNLLAGGALFLFFLILYLVSSGRWIGGGDVKLAGILGLWLGWPGVAVMFALSYLIGGLVGAVLLFTKKAGLKSRIPFGPFLIVGALVAFLWSDVIIQWYLGLFL